MEEIVKEVIQVVEETAEAVEGLWEEIVEGIGRRRGKRS